MDQTLTEMMNMRLTLTKKTFEDDKATIESNVEGNVEGNVKKEKKVVSQHDPPVRWKGRE